MPVRAYVLEPSVPIEVWDVIGSEPGMTLAYLG